MHARQPGGFESRLHTDVEAVAEVRPKNQVTIPREVAEMAGLAIGDRLVFTVDGNDPEHIHVYRVPRSLAGTAPHGYGGERSSAEYLAEERAGWER